MAGELGQELGLGLEVLEEEVSSLCIHGWSYPSPLPFLPIVCRIHDEVLKIPSAIYQPISHSLHLSIDLMPPSIL
jgi:hypothetical protein